MAELEKLEYPKPNREFIYDTFNAFADKHPWVGEENIRPKSIAREMFERFCTFAEYVREYGLQRSEGVLLRYLSDVYKTLVQTVPRRRAPTRSTTSSRTCARMVREVDSSLLDEWEALKQPARRPACRAARRRRAGRSGGRTRAPWRASAPSCTSWWARWPARLRRRGSTLRRSRRGRRRGLDRRAPDRGDGAVLGGAPASCSPRPRPAAPTAPASTSSRPASSAASRCWSTARATRTGRSTARSTWTARRRAAMLDLQRIGV